VFQQVELASSPAAWPPTVRFDFMLDGRPWLWELGLDVLDVVSDREQQPTSSRAWPSRT
jgi:hypothetical protein